MTTLTPYRDSLLQGFEEAERQLQALSLTAPGRYEREMSMGVMRGGLLPAADMLDLDMPLDVVQRSLESAIANLVISHCLNFQDGDTRQAGSMAVQMLAKIRDLAQARLQADRPCVHVYKPIPHPTTTGQA